MSMMIVSDMGGANAVLSRHVFHVTTESYDGATPPSTPLAGYLMSTCQGGAAPRRRVLTYSFTPPPLRFTADEASGLAEFPDPQ